jgi:hypothetical protein
MSGNVACGCGYRGPGVADGTATVCPICRTAAAADATVYHVPCPNGHVLKVREDWLGREMICPTCNAPFVLQATQSLEYRKEEQRRQDEREARQAAVWLNRAIVAGVLIVLSFIAMAVASLNPQWFQP